MNQVEDPGLGGKDNKCRTENMDAWVSVNLVSNDTVMSIDGTGIEM